MIFSISDNGIGVERENTLKIFTLFQRANAPTDKLGHGIGLGTCRKIFEGLGGRIWVKSKPNKGSVFSFTIPNEAEVVALLAIGKAKRPDRNYPGRFAVDKIFYSERFGQQWK